MRHPLHIRKIVTGCIVLLASISIQAQSALLKKADKLFSNAHYIDAIRVYEEVSKQGYEDADLLQKLGDANYYTGDYVTAAAWYVKLFAKEAVQTPEYIFKQGQCLKSVGKEAQGNEYLKQYYSLMNVKYTPVSLKKLDYSGKYTVNKPGFNTPYSDYPAFMDGKNLYVISASQSGYVNSWNNQKTSNIFKVDSGVLKPLKGAINTKYNEGSIVLTKDGNTMYFTRNDFNNNKVSKSKNNVVKVQIYRAHKVKDKWGKVEALPIKNSNYFIAQPALSNDEKTLFFVSDLPGGKGGLDLYSVAILENGSFGKPVNLEKLNTIQNEMFPFVTGDDTLYFSSNGHAGLGGLDVFSSPKVNGSYSSVSNLGSPINSAFDDIAFMEDGKGNGYFGSNREQKNDDVYAFTTKAGYVAPNLIDFNGVVRDSKTGTVLDNAVVSLINSKNEVIERKEIGANGKISFTDLDANTVQMLRIEKEGYLTSEIALPKNNEEGDVFKDVKLDMRYVAIEKGVDLNALINPFYFDFDKSNIREDGKIELQKVIAVMKQHPEIKIEIRSFTDCKGSASYNIQLSNRRAKATLDYLVRGGIARNRLSAFGFGATQFINECSDSSKFNRAKNEVNRRSEFIIK